MPAPIPVDHRKRGARVNRTRPARIQWTPAKLADAEVYVLMNAGRFKWRPCLGPDDVPAHDYFSTEDERICPKCRAKLAERLRGVSPRMYAASCDAPEG